jgi:hypothetical protein
MKDPKEELTKNRFTYRLVAKNEYGYLYSQANKNGIIGYEVFERHKNKRFGCYSFPGDKAFGVWAWSYRRLERAMKKLDELLLAGKEKQKDLLIKVMRSDEENGLYDEIPVAPGVSYMIPSVDVSLGANE